jgi:hypothetical protein
MTTTVEAALTPDEWARRETAIERGEFGENGQVWICEDGTIGVAASGASYEIAHPHGAAALCLHGQPFGFTWEDVRLLERLRGRTDEDEDAIGHLTDRIEALLPSTEPTA